MRDPLARACTRSAGVAVGYRIPYGIHSFTFEQGSPVAKGRRRSNLQWYSFTETNEFNGSENVPIFNVSDTSGGISGFGTTIPSGTVERIFCRCSVGLTSNPSASFYTHVIGGLRHEETVQQAGSQALPALNLAESGAAGYEDILIMDSVILWRAFNAAANDDVELSAGKMLELHSKSKRRLEENDVISMDLAAIAHAPSESPPNISWAVDARILVKQG